MEDNEVARRASSLPGRFSDRVTPPTLEIVELMRAGGEYGELTQELAASLVANGARVSAAERDELRELLEAMGLPAEAASGLRIED